MTTTKKAIKAEISNILNNATDADRKCKMVGLEIRDLFDRLRFLGAEPYTPRGIGDAGLSRKMLNEMCRFNLPYDFYCHIVDYLDA